MQEGEVAIWSGMRRSTGGVQGHGDSGRSRVDAVVSPNERLGGIQHHVRISDPRIRTSGVEHLARRAVDGDEAELSCVRTAVRFGCEGVAGLGEKHAALQVDKMRACHYGLVRNIRSNPVISGRQVHVAQAKAAVFAIMARRLDVTGEAGES